MKNNNFSTAELEIDGRIPGQFLDNKQKIGQRRFRSAHNFVVVMYILTNWSRNILSGHPSTSDVVYIRPDPRDHHNDHGKSAIQTGPKVGQEVGRSVDPGLTKETVHMEIELSEI